MFDKDLFGDDVRPDEHGSTLAKTWEYPPFSVLNAREGWWQERKRQWLALGIKSELGRGGGEQHEPSTAGNEAGRNDGQPAPQRRGANGSGF